MAKIYVDGNKKYSAIANDVQSIQWLVESYQKQGHTVTVKGCKGYSPNVSASTVLNDFNTNKTHQSRTYQSYECPKCGQVGLRQVSAAQRADGTWEIRSVGLVHYDTLDDIDGSVVATKANNFDDIEHTTKARFHDFTDNPAAIGFVDFAGTIPITNSQNS